jgi:large subunit ribosomal protein L17
MRHK